jgi:hypothetical protein
MTEQIAIELHLIKLAKSLSRSFGLRSLFDVFNVVDAFLDLEITPVLVLPSSP